MGRRQGIKLSDDIKVNIPRLTGEDAIDGFSYRQFPIVQLRAGVTTRINE